MARTPWSRPLAATRALRLVGVGVTDVVGGQVEGVEHREQLVDQGRGGPGHLVGLLLQHPLLVVLELGLEPAERVEVLVPLGQCHVEGIGLDRIR